VLDHAPALGIGRERRGEEKHPMGSAGGREDGGPDRVELLGVVRVRLLRVGLLRGRQQIAREPVEAVVGAGEAAHADPAVVARADPEQSVGDRDDGAEIAEAADHAPEGPLLAGQLIPARLRGRRGTLEKLSFGSEQLEAVGPCALLAIGHREAREAVGRERPAGGSRSPW